MAEIHIVVAMLTSYIAYFKVFIIHTLTPIAVKLQSLLHKLEIQLLVFQVVQSVNHWMARVSSWLHQLDEHSNLSTLCCKMFTFVHTLTPLCLRLLDISIEYMLMGIYKFTCPDPTSAAPVSNIYSTQISNRISWRLISLTPPSRSASQWAFGWYIRIVSFFSHYTSMRQTGNWAWEGWFSYTC